MKLFYSLSLIFFFFLFSFAASAQTFFHTGSTVDVNTSPLPGIVLAGGASDNNDAMRWFLQRADGGDIVVIRASGGDGYNNYLFSSLNVTVNSVTSIVISSRVQANNQAVYDAIVNAEALFIAGGNQWDYVNYWKNTLVHDAIQYLIDEKGVTVGGTSAGLAILGEVVYTAQNNTVWSTEALNNPYHSRVTLDNDFLKIPFLEDLVTDSHYNRVQGDDEDRKGRHVAFLARMVADWSMDAKGIGVNEYTAVCVDENGLARVFGNTAHDDFAYFLKVNDSGPEICESDTPLTWNRGGQALSVYKILGNPQGNNAFDLSDWQTASGGEWQDWYVVNGQLFTAQMGGYYQVQFSVRHGITEVPIQGVTVELEGQGTRTTNSSGLAVFADIAGGLQLDYVVSHASYLTEEGSVSVVNENVEKTVLLYPGSGTSVEDQEDMESFKLFPNPIRNGALNIDFPDRVAAKKLLVYNALGLEVFFRELSELHTFREEIPFDHLNPGFYIIRIETSDRFFSFRILKQ